MARRHRSNKHRNFLPTFILAIISWISWLYLIFALPPQDNFLIFAFYLSLFLAVFLTFSLILGHTRRGFLLALALIVYLFLSQIRQAHFLNLILLIGIILSIELYFRQQ